MNRHSLCTTTRRGSALARPALGLAAIALVLAFASAPALAAAEAADGGEKQTYRYYPDYEPGMLKIEKGDFSAYLGARIQVHGAAYAGDDSLISNGDLAEQEGFRLRRSRIYFGGDMLDWASFLISIDVFDQEKSSGPLLDAYIDLTPIPYIGVTAGVTHFPFAMGRLVSSGRLPHLDRALAMEAMAPDRGLGLLLHSQPWEDKITIYAGIFNGLQRASDPFGGFESVNITQGNRFEGVSYIGRVDFAPLGSLGHGVADLVHIPQPRFSVGGAFYFNDSTHVESYGWSAYAHFKWMGFHLLAEYLGDTAEPTAEPPTGTVIYGDTTRMGVTGELGYMILPELLGLAVRVEWLDANADIDDERDEIVITSTLSVYLLRDMLKLQVEYTHREELHGASVENDAALAGLQLTF